MIRNTLSWLAFVTLIVPAVVTAKASFEATPDELAAHLKLNSYAMTCDAIGQAAMTVAMFSHELGLTGPQNTEQVITVLKGYLKKSAPKTRDMGEYAYIAAVPYILANPNIVSAILKASEGAEDGDDARLRAHRELASPCFATSYFPTESGYISTGDAQRGILEMHTSGEK